MDSCSIVNCHRGQGGSSDASFTPQLMMVVASNQAGAGEQEDQTWKISNLQLLGHNLAFMLQSIMDAQHYLLIIYAFESELA